MVRRTFIITGTSRGLGKALVEILIQSDENYIVAISRRLTEEQKYYNAHKFQFFKIDFEKVSISTIFNELKSRIVSDEIYLINNAGVINPIVPVGKIEEYELENSISVNLKPAVLLTNFILKNYRDRKLTFLNISSGAANRVIRNWSLYCSSKAFNQMFFDVAKQ
jgi:benzil reductase ((S)-benzoin forming)